MLRLQFQLKKVLAKFGGRFPEALFIGQEFTSRSGTANPGNVTIEAVPGVNADINAVQQGDPLGGNTTRQGTTGIYVLYPAAFPNVVTLRNLSIRNFGEGITAVLNSKVIIDNCRIEGNQNSGVRVRDFASRRITTTASKTR